MTLANTAVSSWTVESVLSLNRPAQLQLFSSLPAPELAELDGEYLGHAERLSDAEADARQRSALFDEHSPFGYWLGKAFTVTANDAGQGYNHCRKADERVVRHLRFGTRIGPSYVDGKPAFLISYAMFKNRSGAQDLIDEVRRLASGLYLCTATVRMPDGKRSRPTVFVLSGPIGGWIGPDHPEKEQP